MIDVRKLRMLAELDRLGTIAAVAEELQLTAPGISMQLSALEKELGITLTERQGRRLALTPAGKLLAEHGRDVLDRLSLAELDVQGGARAKPKSNTQDDTSRTITIEFDANARGPWEFHPAKRSVEVHPGELTTVMYEFKNVQNRTMAAQAIPSYAPQQAMPYFNKLECFCFNQYTLKPGESKQWPVVFVIDPKLSKDVKTITLSYTFFEVGGSVPAEPQS